MSLSSRGKLSTKPGKRGYCHRSPFSLEGYVPIRVDTAEPGSVNRTFSIIERDDDGKYWLRHYAFNGDRVRLVGKEPFQPGTTDTVTKAAPLAVEQMEAKAAPQPGWFRRQWAALKKRLGGE